MAVAAAVAAVAAVAVAAVAGRNLRSDPPAGSPALLARRQALAPLRQAQRPPLALHAIDDRIYRT